MKNDKTLEIGINEEELQRLLDGEDFVWDFDGQQIHVFKEA